MSIKINLDTGHGSNTAGKRTPPMPFEIKVNEKITIKNGDQFKEHTANVGVAVYLEKELKRCGFDTMRTGWDDDNALDDSDTALKARQSAIAKAGCDYSISIHFNAFGDGKTFNSANGVGIYIHDKHYGQSDKLAKIVLDKLTDGTKQTNRGVTKASLAMCNCNSMDVKAAILIELAFMTNLREATELMANEKYWVESAKEICRGICEYTGIKYVPEDYMPNKAITPESPKEDIKWAQEHLNALLPDLYPRLKVDGNYGPKTRIAVLILWNSLGWGKHMKDDGTRIGKSTREVLAKY